MTDIATPFAETGPVPAIVEFVEVATPALKTTLPPVLTTGVTIDKVLVSAFVEVIVQVEIPAASELEQTPYELTEPVSVALNVGITLTIGLFNESKRVIVIVEVALPFAVTPVVPVMVEFETVVVGTPETVMLLQPTKVSKSRGHKKR